MIPGTQHLERQTLGCSTQLWCTRHLRFIRPVKLHFNGAIHDACRDCLLEAGGEVAQAEPLHSEKDRGLEQLAERFVQGFVVADKRRFHLPGGDYQMCGVQACINDATTKCTDCGIQMCDDCRPYKGVRLCKECTDIKAQQIADTCGAIICAPQHRRHPGVLDIKNRVCAHIPCQRDSKYRCKICGAWYCGDHFSGAEPFCVMCDAEVQCG